MNINRININVGGNPSTGFQGPDRAFDEIASLVGGKLPKEYISLLRQADGGHPEIGCFGCEDEAGAPVFDIDWFYSLGNPDVEGVREAIRVWGPILGPKALPLGRDPGGSQIYALLAEEPASVWMYFPDEGGKRLRIARSIDRFIDALVANPDFI